jgi:putative salt-induced outer membrane protein YdiY
MLRRKVTIALALAGVLVLAVARPAQSQAPCPCPPAPEKGPPLWEGKVSLGYAATGGNSSTSTLTTGFDVAYRPLPWTIKAKFDYLRSSSEDVLTAESLAGLLAGVRDLSPLWDVFIQTGYERNIFAGLDSRTGVEGGAGIKLLRGPEVLLRAEAAFGYRHEKDSNGEKLDYASARAGAKFVWKFSKSADFTDEVSFLEDLSDSKNWIFRNSASVTAAMTSLLSLRASYGLVYDNEPVPGFKSTDTVTSVALVAKF